MTNLEATNTPMKHAVDAGMVITSTSSISAALAGWITMWGGALAAILTVGWFSYQIYDLWDRRRRRTKKKPRQR